MARLQTPSWALAATLLASGAGLARAERYVVEPAPEAGTDAPQVVEGALIYETADAYLVQTDDGEVELLRARVLEVDGEHEATSFLVDRARRARKRAFREFHKDAKRALRRYGKAEPAERGAYEAELAVMPDAALLEPLGDALDDDRAATRELAARLLGASRVQPAATDALLRAAMTSRRGQTRAEAHTAAFAANPQRTRAVYEAVAMARTKPDRRVAALGFLGRMGPASLPAIIGVLEYVNGDIRAVQAQAGELRRIPVNLGTTGGSAINVPIELPELTLVEVNTSYTVASIRPVQAQAVRALQALSGEDFGTDHDAWRSWHEREGGQ